MMWLALLVASGVCVLVAAAGFSVLAYVAYIDEAQL